MSSFAQRMQLGPFFSTGEIEGAALLSHYAAGTLTTKPIWSDRAMTLPLAQPFEADADGMFNFFADGLYDIVITSADGTVLYTLEGWQMIDRADPTFAEGNPITSASTIAVGPEIFTHVQGTTNIDVLTGTIPFVWLVFDGILRVNHSATLLCPDGRNYTVRVGECGFFLNEGAGVWRLAGHWIPSKQTDIASASSITAPAHNSLVDITGVADIDGIVASFAGHTFMARFTNAAGLNLNHSASFLMPWGFDYHTIQNELCQFIAVTSSIWAMAQLTGPRVAVGTTIEDNSSTPLPGFFEEDGTTFVRADYSGLFARIGTTFGVGDGSTTANKPDSRGRAAINVDGAANRITAASTNGGNADTLGGVGGAETHTLAISEMPAHTHPDTEFTSSGPGAAHRAIYGVGGQTTNASAASGDVASQGGGGAHNNTQPWIAKKKYIRF